LTHREKPVTNFALSNATSYRYITEDGIDAVIPGRQAVEQRVVSQDLELWWGLHKPHQIQLTHSLKPPGSNP
jgi:SpoVK/Ycf46/Vps4 family AAA+-type ATPase